MTNEEQKTERHSTRKSFVGIGKCNTILKKKKKCGGCLNAGVLCLECCYHFHVPWIPISLQLSSWPPSLFRYLFGRPCMHLFSLATPSPLLRPRHSARRTPGIFQAVILQMHVMFVSFVWHLAHTTTLSPIRMGLGMRYVLPCTLVTNIAWKMLCFKRGLHRLALTFIHFHTGYVYTCDNNVGLRVRTVQEQKKASKLLWLCYDYSTSVENRVWLIFPIFFSLLPRLHFFSARKAAWT